MLQNFKTSLKIGWIQYNPARGTIKCNGAFDLAWGARTVINSPRASPLFNKSNDALNLNIKQKYKFIYI